MGFEESRSCWFYSGISSLEYPRILDSCQICSPWEAWRGAELSLFFVLSGFLIGGILLDATGSTRYFRTFYARRAFRILPLYGLVTGLFLASHFPLICSLLQHECSASEIPLASYPTFTQNFWIAYLGTWGLNSGEVVTWSLAVEEQFYLTIPIIIRKLTDRTLSRR